MLVDYTSSDEEREEASASSSAAEPQVKVVAAPEVSLEDPMQLSMSLVKPTDTRLSYNMPYSDLSRPFQGPANPFKAHGDVNESNILKRKNVLTGHAEEAAISAATFNAQQRTFTSLGYARDPAALSGTGQAGLIGNMDSAKLHGGRDVIEYRPSKAETGAIRAKRFKKGDASVLEGEGAYKGPWAGYHDDEQALIDEALTADAGLASGEEYEEESIAPVSNPIIDKPGADYLDVNTTGVEQTEFHGKNMYDYQGRTYMHVPQDLDVDLGKEVGSITNFIPKKLVHTWNGHTKPITALRFFPKSGHILLSSGADSKIKLWDVYHERELLRSFSGHTKSITDITFLPDTGKTFLSASYDRNIKLWDTETGACLSRFTTGKIPHVIKFNPSQPHEFLAGMSDKKIVQFDIRTQQVVQEYDYHLGPVNTITFVDEDRRFITTSDDKSLRAWEYGLPVPIKFIAEPYMYPLVRAVPHPSGKYVAYQSGDNQIVVYASTDKFRQNRKKSFRGHNNAGYAIDLDISPDGQFLVSGDSGGYVCFWSWRGGKMYHKIQVGEQAVNCVAWSPQESSKVVTGGLDGLIKFWD
ncbi:WD40-repeat-containing domain protein [Peziza echinospora]|nr:WD40-repeat-containing domain protein [Peziza echinospora]